MVILDFLESFLFHDINSIQKLEKFKPNFSLTLKGPCLYLLMSLNDYLGLLVKVDGATSISIILLVDIKAGSFSSNKYVSTPWVKHTRTT
jgi:hypothetical protein